MAALGMLLDPIRLGSEAEVLESKLRKRVVGQDEAIHQIVDVYQTFLAGLTTPGTPIGSFLFLGPTGSGKTRTVEAVAEALTGDPRAMIKIDCAEYQHGHEIAKLIGSPPGYVGHGETHPLLSQEMLNQYQTESVKLSFVLFDEIEKASDALWNLLLGILDKATLTLGDNQRVDFSRTMIFLTSNLGAREIDSLFRPKLGFAPKAEPLPSGAPSAAAGQENAQVSHAGVEAARRRFSPEFINRLDKIVVFRPLGKAELRGILRLELDLLRDRIHRATGTTSIKLEVSGAVEDFLLQEGTDARLWLAPSETNHRPSAGPSTTEPDRQIQIGDSVQVELAGVESRGRLIFVKPKKGLAGRTAEFHAAVA